MPRCRRLLVILLLAVAAGLGSVAAGAGDADAPRMAVTGAALLAPPNPPPVEDPFPIARVRVTEGQLADALAAFDPGTVVRMPRAEFEVRVRKAGLAAADARIVPRIIEAKYAAALSSGGTLAGTLEWVVTNPRPRAAPLPLDPLRIALRSPAWADGSEAVVGTFGAGFPAGPGLWVPGPGRHVLTAKWSAAGTAGAGERRFEVRVPPCPAAVLELELPSDRTPTAGSADVLLTGPFPVPANAAVRTWRFRFGNRGRLEFGVRGPGESGTTLTLASLAAKYDLAPGQIACSFEYDLSPARGSVGEWAFALSPGLRVTDAVANNRAGWRVDPATNELRVTLRQPGTGGKVLVTAAAPLPARGQTTPLPMVRPVGAVVGEERVEVRVHPDLELEHLDPADYRLTDSTPTADQGRVATLVGSLLPQAGSEPFRRPPTVRVAGSEPEFVTDEGVEWRIEGGRTYLVARVGVRVRRGPLFRLALQAPPGFVPGPVASIPEDVVAYAGPTPGQPPGVEVEFARPVAIGQRVDLRLEFRGPVVPAGGGRVTFPHLSVLGATERDGWVSLFPGPGWAVAPRPSPGAKEATEFDWPDAAPADAAAVYFYRGKEPDGEMLLAPVPPAFTAAASTRLDFSGDRLIAATRLTLKVTAGQLPGVTVFEPGPVRAGRTWTVADGSNAVAAATPVFLGGLPGALPLLARPGAGFAPVAAVAAGSEPGTYWFVRFAQPVSGRVVLETRATAPGLKPDEARRRAADFAAGRRDVLAVRGTAGHSARVELSPVLGGMPAASSPVPRAWAFDGLYLVTLCPDAHALAVFGGTVTARGGAGLPVRVPAGAEVRAACVGGHWLDPGRCGPAPGGDEAELRLPLPAGDGPVRFEVRYRLPADVGRIVRAVRSPVPGLPGGPHPAGRYWVLPRGVAAAWPFVTRDRTAAELPLLLGEPFDRAAGQLSVSRFPAETVTTVPERLADAVGVGLAAVLAALAWAGARRANRSIGLALLAVLIGAGVAVLLGPTAWERAALPPLVVSLVGAAVIAVIRGGGKWPPGTATAPPTPSGRRAAATVGAALLLAAVPLLANGSQTREAGSSPSFTLSPCGRGWFVSGANKPGEGSEAISTPHPAAFGRDPLPQGERVKTGPVLPAPRSRFIVAPGADPAPRDVVFVLTGPPGDPARETVVAPRSTLDRLAAILKQPEPAAVIASASYDGRADEGLAHFTARFAVRSFRDGETAVGLPLADARLERVTVDGKPAHPAAPRPDLYTVAVSGRGRHEIEAEFAVPVTGTGPEREARFGVPEVPDSRLTFAAPAAARQLQAVGRFGEQKAAADKGAVRLEADLGGARAAHLRWRQGAGGTESVSVREGCVWDVSEARHELTACYQVRVETGAVSAFRFDLPAGLEPVRVAVRSLDAAAGPGVLRDWSVGKEADGLRPLRIDLQGPTDGRLLVVLECVPRGVPGRHPELRFPRPVGMTRTDAVYGLRATGVSIEGVARPGMIDFPADALAREFGAVPDLRLGSAAPVSAFSPRPGAAGGLRPNLRPGPEPPTVSQELTWRVGPHRADGGGTIRWAAKDPVPVVEFALPATVSEVRGADVAGWAQAGGRVQVWFRKPVKEGSLEWLGTTPPSPAGKPVPEPLAFDVPVPAVMHARAASQTARAVPADGWAGRVDRDKGWLPAKADGRGWAFRTDGPPPPLRVLLYPPRGGPARGFGLAEVGGPTISYRATVELPLPANRPNHVVIRVAGLPAGATVRPDLPPGTAKHERWTGNGEREWDVDVPASPAAVFRAAVVVRFPTPGTAKLPTVWCGVGGTAPDPTGVVRWVGVTGENRGIRLDGATPASAADLTAIQKAWPGEADRLRRAGGSAWAVSGGPPALVFAAAPAAPSPPAAAGGLHPAPSPTAAADTAAAAPAEPSRLPALTAAGWCAVVLAVAGLFARLPRLTWPEQVGLLAGLFGFAVAGGLLVGLVAYLLARASWLAVWAGGRRATS